MNYLTRRQKIACAVVGMAAGALVVGWDGIETIYWVGGRDVRVTIESPHRVESVRIGGVFRGEREYAEKYREIIAKSGSQNFKRLDFISVQELRGGQPFVMTVRTCGTESGLKLTRNTFSQYEHHAVVVIELDNGEEWVAVLDLPDVQQSTQATIRLPGDARRVRSVAKAER